MFLFVTGFATHVQPVISLNRFLKPSEREGPFPWFSDEREYFDLEAEINVH